MNLNSTPTMKFVVIAALVGYAAAFVPTVSRTSSYCSSGPLAAVQAAKNAQEDLELTLKVIMSSMTDDGAGVDDSDDDTPDVAVTATKAAATSSSGVTLWSVDYDAAARLAYEAAGSNGDFGAFKSKYLEDMSAMVAKKGLL